MTDDDPRGELWDELSSVEDWLGGGLRRGRGRPDFAPLATAPAAEPAPPAASAELRASGARAGIAGAPQAGDRASRLPLPPRLPEAEARERLAELARGVAACQACRLATTRRNAVFGVGSAAPEVLVVGEGPGAEEDSTGQPFVGPAGQLLDRMLAAIGLSRSDNVFIANVVKCRPPGNRDPAPDEIAPCAHWLDSTIDILAPRAILCLGRTAMRALTGAEEGITRMRGRWLEYRGIPLIPTFHPSALLREESLKRPAWEDLKALRERLDGGRP